MKKKNNFSKWLILALVPLLLLGGVLALAYDPSYVEASGGITPTALVGYVSLFDQGTPTVVVPEETVLPEINTIQFSIGSISAYDLENAGFIYIETVPTSSAQSITLPSGGPLLPPPFIKSRLSGFRFDYLPADWAEKNKLSPGAFHQGLDLGGSLTPASICNGTINFAGPRETVRAAVNIYCSPETMPGHTVEIRYYHLNDSTFPAYGVYTGAPVTVGQLLGELAPKGACGTLCDGPHLHLEFRIDGKNVNPELYIALGW